MLIIVIILRILAPITIKNFKKNINKSNCSSNYNNAKSEYKKNKISSTRFMLQEWVSMDVKDIKKQKRAIDQQK